MLNETEPKPDLPMHVVYGTLFTLIAIVALVALVVVLRSQADTTSGTVTVTNTVPTVDTVTIATSAGGVASDITLTEGDGTATTTTVYIHGEATDLNSCEEINDVATSSAWTVKFFRTDVASGSNCTVGNDDCYTVSILDAELTNCDNAADTSLDYDFTVAIRPFADATDVGSSPDHNTTTWTASVDITDDNSGAATQGTTTQEINTLKALNVDASVGYGSLALGADSAQQDTVVTNTGNHNALNANVSQAAAWSCTPGAISIGNLHWSLATGFTYGTADDTLTSTPTSTVMAITKSTGTASTDNWYSILRIPSSGASGACTATITFTAA